MAGLLGVLVAAAGATRVLEIGAGEGDSALDIVSALPAAGLLITIERNAVSASRLRTAFAAAGVSHQATVVMGDASRYLHKVSGPFDLIHQSGDSSQYDMLHERVLGLLRAGGTLVTRNTHAAEDYNKKLVSDPRLTTVSLDLGGGIAISVKRQDST